MSVAALERITEQTDPRSAARIYRDAGLDPIPIHGLVAGRCTCGRADCTKSAGKHPMGKQWQTREVELSEFSTATNVGLRMGGSACVIAIDVDGPDGFVALAELEDGLGCLPATLTSQSGSGAGQHRLFLVTSPEGLTNSAKRIGRNIDIRTTGGQIVVAPSLHLSGGRYQWISVNEIAQLPERWEARLRELAKDAVVGAEQRAAVPLADPDAIERRAIAYVRAMPPAIQGSGGSVACFNAALALVWDFGLSENAALAILRGEYNPTCQPPWSERELAHKVNDALAKGRRSGEPRGHLAAENRPEWRARLENPPPRDDADYVPEMPEWYRAEYGADPNAPRDTVDIERSAIAEESESPEAQAAPKTETPKTSSAVRLFSMAELLTPVLAEMQAAGTRPPQGVPSGNEELDRGIGRFRRGNVTILGGKRSFGKTSCTIMTIDEALNNGHQVIIFAAEDAMTMYGKRFMSRRAGIAATALRDMEEKFGAADIKKAVDAIGFAPKPPFFVPAIGMVVEDIAAAIKRLAAELNVELFIIDYLQCVQARKRSADRRVELTYIAATLSAAIKNANSSGILVSQLRRTQNPWQRPTVEDLKESGDLENAAEHILLGHREKAEDPRDPDKRILIIAKNKDGPDDLPDIELSFDARTASFIRKYSELPEKPPPHWNEPKDPDDYNDFDNAGRNMGPGF